MLIDSGLPKLISHAIRRQCQFAKGDRSGGDAAEKWLRFDWGDVGNEMVTGMGEGDVDGVETDEEWIYRDSRVLRPVLGVSLAFWIGSVTSTLSWVCV